jgi:hypothetical protein
MRESRGEDSGLNDVVDIENDNDSQGFLSPYGFTLRTWMDMRAAGLRAPAALMKIQLDAGKLVELIGIEPTTS